MKSSHRAPWAAPIVTGLLLLGSVGVAGPASADASATGREHSAAGRAHADQGHRAEHTSSPTQRDEHANREAPGGSSTVSLDRPNGFQAQADPDGMDNGGVDQPGGAGGVDTSTQDGNNGSGNDTDCEDDNRGVGLPGHCEDRPEVEAPDEVVPPETDVAPVEDTSTSSDSEEAAPTATTPPAPAEAVTPLALVSPPAAAAVLAPQLGRGTALPQALAAPDHAAAVLPNTGAGSALTLLAVLGLATLAVGGALLRVGRRTVA